MLVRNDLDSSNLANCEYDTDTMELKVEFNNGRKYAYSDVGVDVWQGLITASSAGQYFNAMIKNQYQTVEV